VKYFRTHLTGRDRHQPVYCSSVTWYSARSSEFTPTKRTRRRRRRKNRTV